MRWQFEYRIMAVKTIANLTCPSPLPAKDTVLLGHGSGGTLSGELVRDLFLPAFHNAALDRLDDQAILHINGSRLAFTTDSFVVKPLFFPGGNIGSLAVHGTINDLAMGGAKPLFLSVAFILEEGLSMDTLRRVVESMREAATDAGVAIVTGDTKVVEKGSGDQLFINTTGIGLVPEGVELSANLARPGDAVLLSGTIGDHGIAILAQREGLEFESLIESDSAPLHGLVSDMLTVTSEIRCMRDPTRGGVSSTLNEIAASSNVGIELVEREIPVREEVRGACEMLGLDPLYVANEGKLIAIVAPQFAQDVLAAMRCHPLGKDSRIIGKVCESHPGLVTMRTEFGTRRIVDMLAGDQLPRIC
jgi:hydrogenase expression/formation protein HypE